MRLEPPIGLLNLASFLVEHGYECQIVNTAFQEVPWEDIKNGEYILVGFTVFIGEFMKNAKEFSAKIKKVNPNMPICYGGKMASIIPGQLLQEYQVDYIIRYEGEYSLLELIQYLEGSTNHNPEIRGISYKLDGEVIHNPPRMLEKNLDHFPVPRWELLKESVNLNQEPYYFRITASLGCPFKCSFCHVQSVDAEIRSESPAWRYRSADHVIKELQSLHELTGTRVFTFGDDNFCVLKDRVMKILDFFRKNSFYIEQCISHLNNLKPDIIEKMGGIVQTVVYSLESASPRLMKIMQKPLNLEKVPEVNQQLFDNGITTTHNIMVGIPTETDEDLRANVEFMLRLKKINPFVRSLTYLFFPLPETPLATFAEKEYGLKLPDTIKDYQDACLDSGVEKGKKFRPWLDDERYMFLHNYCRIYDDVFQVNNLDLSEDSVKLLRSNSKLRELFDGIAKVNRPKRFYRPYVLDRLLKKEKIDLLNDIKKHV